MDNFHTYEDPPTSSGPPQAEKFLPRNRRNSYRYPLQRAAGAENFGAGGSKLAIFIGF